MYSISSLSIEHYRYIGGALLLGAAITTFLIFSALGEQQLPFRVSRYTGLDSDTEWISREEHRHIFDMSIITLIVADVILWLGGITLVVFPNYGAQIVSTVWSLFDWL